MHSAVLLRDQVSALQQANELATKRRARKKKRIQREGTLTVAEGAEIVTQKAAEQHLQQERCQEAGQSSVGRRAAPRCGRCKESGHNSRTCQKETIDATQS